MTGIRLTALALAVMLVSGMTSCWPFKKSKSQPVARAPMPIPPARAPAPPEPLPAPPELPAQEAPAEPPEIVREQPAPIPPPPKKRPSPLGPPVEPAPAPAPQLRPILTPRQKVEYERLIAGRIARARQVLAALGGRSLSESQAAQANQIRTFIRQAEEAQKDDLVRAANLAERADVLARDLMRAVR